MIAVQMIGGPLDGMVWHVDDHYVAINVPMPDEGIPIQLVEDEAWPTVDARPLVFSFPVRRDKLGFRVYWVDRVAR